MKKIDVLMTVLVLAVAFGGMYFLFASFGLAGGNYVKVVVSDGLIEPSEVVMNSVGVIGVVNEGSSYDEVEIIYGNNVVWRRNIVPGETYNFKALVTGTYYIRAPVQEDR